MNEQRWRGHVDASYNPPSKDRVIHLVDDARAICWAIGLCAVFLLMFAVVLWFA